MKFRGLVILLTASFLSGNAVNAQDASSGSNQPNILVIMTDDQAQWASSVYGNTELRTPNMEFLARTGIKFNRANTISTVCSPSRATFFTGRIPSQHGVHDVLSENPNFDHDWLKDEIFLPELLQESGYSTALIGKWHSTTDCLPVQRGWDKWFTYNVHIEGWQNQYVHRGDIHYSDQGKPLTLTGHQSQHLTQEAIRFLETTGVQQKPFFLFLGLVDTHAPFNGAPSRLASKYRQATFNDIPQNESSYLPLRNDYSKIPPDHREQLAQYYAGVQMMDDQLGVLLDYLEGVGQLDNTLIIFTSDHGHMNGHHGLYGKGNATTPQNFFEESILVPLLIRWPTGFPMANQSLDIPVNQTDLFQTILDAAKVTLSRDRRQQINSPGKSLLPYLTQTDSNWRSFQFCEYGNARMISDGQYKLVVRYAPYKPGFQGDFFDLENDPRETTNLFGNAAYLTRIQKMTRQLHRHFEQYDTGRFSATRLSEQKSPNAIPIWKR